ncbi:MAG: aldo/keto reductase [Erysipelotrichales bacterium]|nr:aldo/keto reductase [Erysipelotrichales bacterium]
MQYRKLGNTGFEISTLSFGCMRLPEIEADGKFTIDQEKVNVMLKKAYEAGVNYFDTAYYYCHNNSEAAVGIALKPFRDKVAIATKFPVSEVKERSDMRKFLNIQLERLQTDYIDYYHFWALNIKTFNEKVLGFNLLEEAEILKKEGLIKHIAFSFHDDPKNLYEIIDKAYCFETLLIQYNLLNREHEPMIEYAAKKGLGVIVMGPVAGGKLAHPAALAEKLLGNTDVSTYELAFKFVLNNPHVASALSGMENIEELDKNLKIASEFKQLSTTEWQMLENNLSNLRKLKDLFCTGCNYCNKCPQNIKIDKIFNAYIFHHVYGLEEAGKSQYKAYLQNAKNGQVESCTDCGICEDICPQKLKIREDLRKVDTILK